MWWVIGIAVLAVVAFGVSKFRTASHQMQLITAGRTHIWQSFKMLNPGSDDFFNRQIDGLVWRDPYLLGYAQGSLAMMTTFFGKRLNITQKGMVTVRVLQDLVGEGWEAVCERIERFNRSRDAEFMRGMTHGSNVAILMANRAGPELLADPDVQTALRQAP